MFTMGGGAPCKKVSRWLPSPAPVEHFDENHPYVDNYAVHRCKTHRLQLQCAPVTPKIALRSRSKRD